MRKTIYSTRKQLFVRLLIMYHVIILPIILLGLYLYLWSYDNASNEMSKHTSIQLHSYLKNLEREIEWMEGQQYTLLQEDDLKRLALIWDDMDSVDKKKNVNYMIHRLITIKNTSSYINNISIHIQTIEKSISALHGVKELDKEQYKTLYSNITNHHPFIMLNESVYLIASIMTKSETGEPLYLIQIELDKEKLDESLESINVYDESGIFLVSEDKKVISSSNGASDKIVESYLNSMENEDYQNHNFLKVEDQPYYFDHAFTAKSGLFAISYLPEEMVKRPLSIFRNWVWFFSIFSIVAIIIYTYSTYNLVHRPLLVLVESFKRMEKGSLNVPIKHKKKDEFGFIYNRYNLMQERLKALIDRNYKQTLMVQKAELKQLQSQINPHFLYNSFFILNSLAKTEDTERIELFTNMLGEYFKFITRNEKNLVTLDEEIKHARLYTEIQNMRFSRRITVQFDDLPHNLEKIMVPKLIVQPIIENAYKYSLEKLTQHGFLRITFKEMNSNEIAIIVEDNGDILKGDEIIRLQQRLENKEEQGELTGLANIHRRLVLTYENGSGLYLSKSSLSGLQVELRIKQKEGNLDV
ncbi:histidine kinase [Bacillus sp. TS-2]|nr:histidine kinase [Bacillus sp. TS-2]